MYNKMCLNFMKNRDYVEKSRDAPRFFLHYITLQWRTCTFLDFSSRELVPSVRGGGFEAG